MPNYKRCRNTGGTYFFTVNLANRKSGLLVDEFNLFSSVVREVKNSRPFQIHGWVVLPDHLHCLWTLPENDNDYSKRWWAIKSLYSRRYRQKYNLQPFPIWQKRFWEHCIRDQRDFDMHLNYIHINPVKHGYVNQVKDWPYSSFSFFVNKKIYAEDWGGNIQFHPDSDFGE